MPSTYFCLHVHVIFSTKERRNLINPAWEDRLHALMGSVLSERGVEPVAIGGVADHVHLLIRIKPTHALSDVMRELKSVSSKWVREQRLEPIFGWQEGYAVLAVSSSKADAVARYIGNQAEHHRVMTSEEEFRRFLRKAGIDWDGARA
jgi:putative transposase